MIRQWLPTILIAAMGPCAMQAPTHLGIDDAPARFKRLVEGVKKHENCKPPLARTCLSFHSQPGAYRTRKGYAAFRDSRARERASVRDLEAKWERGMTVEQIVSRYNPVYLEALLAETGLNRSDKYR